MYNHSQKSFTQSLKSSKLSFFKQMSTRLQQLSNSLAFNQFHELFGQIFKKSIKKIQTDLFTKQISIDIIDNLKNWLHKYGSSLQLEIRLLILDAQVNYKQFPQESLSKLNKVKHLLVDTQYQYLLPKVFILESKIYRNSAKTEKLDLIYKTLKKSIQYGENYVVQFLKQSNQIRLQLADSMIISYFEMYKHTKQQFPQSHDKITYNLNKAYKAALKNYGPEHFSVISLAEVLSQEKKLITGLNRYQQHRPVTQIATTTISHNLSLNVFYNWQDEALICILKKSKNTYDTKLKQKQQKIIAQNGLSIKLDMNCIKCLKNVPYSEYIQISTGVQNSYVHTNPGYTIIILQQELVSIVSRMGNSNLSHQTNFIQKKVNVSLLNIKPIGKDEAIKTDTERVSSSSSDNEAVLGQHQTLLRCLYYGTNTNLGGGLNQPHTQNFIKGHSRHNSQTKSKDAKTTRD